MNQILQKENKEMQEIPIIEVSAKKNHGINEFETVLKDMFLQEIFHLMMKSI